LAQRGARMPTGAAEKDVLAARSGRLLRERGWTLGIAESCTGGLIGHRITNVPGSSDYFLGDVVAYATATKVLLLNVAPESLREFGAVSAEVATEMAQGIRDVLRADVGISVTGIAGPGGGTPEKPVGLVFIALVTSSRKLVERHVWDGDREENKLDSADAALRLLCWVLEGGEDEGAKGDGG